MTQPLLSYIDAMDIIGGLSNPSKMPGDSWSISAFECKTGSKLREVKGSTCSSCYAMKGMYRFKNVKEAHAKRLTGLYHPQFVEAFIFVLSEKYRRSRVKETRFRWHDSGDLQDLEHLTKINTIASRTLFLQHWLPTREFGIVKEWLKENPQGFSSNLTVRLSAVMIGDTFKARTMGLPFSTVGVTDNTVEQCKAPQQDGKCLSCNACWDKSKDINYPLH